MKTPLACFTALLLCLELRADDRPAPVRFENGNLTPPPLSLQQIVTTPAAGTASKLGGTFEPNGNTGDFQSTLLPGDANSILKVLREAAPRRSQPPVSSMPIIAPRDDVDYRLTIKRPDPSVDFKMIVKDVAPPADAGAK